MGCEKCPGVLGASGFLAARALHQPFVVTSVKLLALNYFAWCELQFVGSDDTNAEAFNRKLWVFG